MQNCQGHIFLNSGSGRIAVEKGVSVGYKNGSLVKKRQMILDGKQCFNVYSVFDPAAAKTASDNMRLYVDLQLKKDAPMG